MASYLLFLFAFFLHNAEEAVWLVRQSGQPAKHRLQLHLRPTQDQFLFAALMITALAVLLTALRMFYPGSRLISAAFFGYLGAMVLNVLLVHLPATIVERRYSPGLLTGLLALVPVNGLLLVDALQHHALSVLELLAATVVMAISLLLMIRLLFWLAARWLG